MLNDLKVRFFCVVFIVLIGFYTITGREHCQLMRPHTGEFANFNFKNANARGSSQGEWDGGGID